MKKKFACQKKFVEYILNKDGYISRNKSANSYIYRLGSVIYTLKRQGYKIVGKTVIYKEKNIWGENKKDYVYLLENNIDLKLTIKNKIYYKILYKRFYK